MGWASGRWEMEKQQGSGPKSTPTQENNNMAATAWRAIAIYNPKKVVDATGTDKTPAPSIIARNDLILAPNADAAKLIFAGEIPAAFHTHMEDVTVTVVAF